MDPYLEHLIEQHDKLLEALSALPEDKVIELFSGSDHSYLPLLARIHASRKTNERGMRFVFLLETEDKFFGTNSEHFCDEDLLMLLQQRLLSFDPIHLMALSFSLLGTIARTCNEHVPHENIKAAGSASATSDDKHSLVALISAFVLESDQDQFPFVFNSKRTIAAIGLKPDLQSMVEELAQRVEGRAAEKKDTLDTHKTIN